MPRPNPSTPTAQLARLTQKLRQWRISTGSSRRPIPLAIWESAGEVAANLGVGLVAKELALNYTKLKGLSASRQQASPLVTSPSTPTPATFFELTSTPSLSETLAACVITVESGCGGRMRIEAPGVSASGLALIVREFRGVL